jgi:hypothetical protein
MPFLNLESIGIQKFLGLQKMKDTLHYFWDTLYIKHVAG